MSDEKNHPFEAHLFICTHSRDGKECCAAKDSAGLRDELKSLVKKHPEWKGRVRVNASGCLDRCSQGIAAVLYPTGRWFESLNRNDVATLEAAIEEELRKPK